MAIDLIYDDLAYAVYKSKAESSPDVNHSRRRVSRGLENIFWLTQCLEVRRKLCEIFVDILGNLSTNEKK